MTPGLNEPTILGEFEDAGIVRGIAAMAVGNKNIAICANRYAGRSIEGIYTTSAHAHFAQRHQHLAILVELENLLSKSDTSGIAR